MRATVLQKRPPQYNLSREGETRLFSMASLQREGQFVLGLTVGA